MTNPLIVADAATIDAAWMTMALRAAGVLGSGSVAGLACALVAEASAQRVAPRPEPHR